MAAVRPFGDENRWVNGGVLRFDIVDNVLEEFIVLLFIGIAGNKNLHRMVRIARQSVVVNSNAVEQFCLVV